MAKAGYCSRRQALELIFKGRVRVNENIVLEPSTPVDCDGDKVSADDTLLKIKSYSYVLMNKPKGYVTTVKDRHAEKTVLDLLPKEYKHLYPAGRLDKDTEGLLLLTNDGDAAYRLTHPKFNVDKTYVVRIKEGLKPSDQARLEKGIPLDSRLTAPSKITNVKLSEGGTEFHMTIHEGRKRQIRLMLKQLGCHVTHLMRIRQGPLTLGDLKIGGFRLLSEQEISALKKCPS